MNTVQQMYARWCVEADVAEGSADHRNHWAPFRDGFEAAGEAVRLDELEAIRNQVREAYGQTDQVQVDEDATVDVVEDGAWVTARIFVSNED